LIETLFQVLIQVESRSTFNSLDVLGLLAMIKLCAYRWVKEWCDGNGWTDLFVERYHYWAFPPGAVMPTPVPLNVLQEIRAAKGWTPIEQLWAGIAISAACLASVGSYWLSSPLPLVMAFSVCAIAVAFLDDETA
jgi:hypothetical protein